MKKMKKKKYKNNRNNKSTSSNKVYNFLIKEIYDMFGEIEL